MYMYMESTFEMHYASVKRVVGGGISVKLLHSREMAVLFPFAILRYSILVHVHIDLQMYMYM